ncbi:MAG: hypothetical protein R6V32_10270 [Bacteroidales bacterium]
MKNKHLLSLLLAVFFLSACEKEDDFGTHPAHLRFVNHTSMTLDSIKNTFSKIPGHAGQITQIYTNLQTGDTTEYQESENVSEMLEINIFANDSTYFDVWHIPSNFIDPVDPENGPFLRNGYYTFSIYPSGSLENHLEVALLEYSYLAD